MSERGGNKIQQDRRGEDGIVCRGKRTLLSEGERGEREETDGARCCAFPLLFFPTLTLPPPLPATSPPSFSLAALSIKES